jgi:hypothetical protein
VRTPKYVYWLYYQAESRITHDFDESCLKKLHQAVGRIDKKEKREQGEKELELEREKKRWNAKWRIRTGEDILVAEEFELRLGRLHKMHDRVKTDSKTLH